MTLLNASVLGQLLRSLADAGVCAILLKGTAVACDLYASPATPARGDSDLRVAPADLDRARSALQEQGYLLDPSGGVMSEDFSLQ